MSTAYHLGIGIEKNDVKALSWATLFALYVNSKVGEKLVKDINKEMTLGEIESAAGILGVCIKQKFLGCEL